MPETNIGSLLSIVDKIDTLVGFFIIGKKPTGSKDPFALRRNGFSIAQILINWKPNMSLNEIFAPSLEVYLCSSKTIKFSLVEFMIDKLKFILSNQNKRIDVIDSVLNTKVVNDLPIKTISNRIDIIIKFTKNNAFKTFLANFKRINNILKNEKFSNDDQLLVKIKFFETVEEENIYNFVNFFSKEINEKGGCDKSQNILIKSLIKINDTISLFFDNVIVNHDNYNIKKNRLNLLKNLHNLILKFSNFELIEN